jgi:hypothetical protein
LTSYGIDEILENVVTTLVAMFESANDDIEFRYILLGDKLAVHVVPSNAFVIFPIMLTLL